MLDCSLNNMNLSIYKSAQKVKSSKIKISSNVQFTKRLSNALGLFFKENTNSKKDNPKKCLNNYKDCQFKKNYENHDSTEFNLDSLITVEQLCVPAIIRQIYDSITLIVI
ncbi:hypothetical protein A3Q56_05589 [Intoshia linei]|uniref:Uncharacterized protein n=1 Tax=Intoshia linei TaxID=1819745 RepID=A0A177AXH7_9BILA|nr:hypothetical protein A3Q56_05589 [Intoshia linei]